MFAVTRWELAGAAVVEPRGVLDAGTYRELRDILVKAAVDEPRAVIVDLDGLEAPDQSSYALFSSVSEQVARWPGVPLLLVAGTARQRDRLAGYRMARYVAVHPSVAAAVAAIGAPPPRRLARRRLPNAMTSASLAREFVRAVCEQWSVGPGTEDAVAIVNELVENTLLHTYCVPSVRLELRRGMLSVAVYDDDPAPARLREPDPRDRHGHGLTIVAAVAVVWGCSPTPAGGKVTWAVLRVPSG
jgi:hypothetical protein